MMRGLAKFKEPWKMGRQPVRVSDWSELEPGDMLKSRDGRHVAQVKALLVGGHEHVSELEFEWIRGHNPENLNWREAWRTSN